MPRSHSPAMAVEWAPPSPASSTGAITSSIMSGLPSLETWMSSGPTDLRPTGNFANLSLSFKKEYFRFLLHQPPAAAVAS
jgi:hypothetical protein